MDRLLPFIKQWGGEVVYLSSIHEYPRGVSEAPFSNSLAIDHARRILYLAPHFEVGEVIHEMGHVFACRVSPFLSDEIEFVGWEFTLARKAGLVDEWLESMWNYGIGETSLGSEFRDLSLDDQSEFLEWAVRQAEDLGLISGDEPLCIR